MEPLEIQARMIGVGFVEFERLTCLPLRVFWQRGELSAKLLGGAIRPT
jgi:hypothetical protein